MLKDLKLLSLIPKQGIKPLTLLLLIMAAELLVLGWLTWLIFHN